MFSTKFRLAIFVITISCQKKAVIVEHKSSLKIYPPKHEVNVLVSIFTTNASLKTVLDRVFCHPGNFQFTSKKFNPSNMTEQVKLRTSLRLKKFYFSSLIDTCQRQHQQPKLYCYAFLPHDLVDDGVTFHNLQRVFSFAHFLPKCVRENWSSF